MFLDIFLTSNIINLTIKKNINGNLLEEKWSSKKKPSKKKQNKNFLLSKYIKKNITRYMIIK